MILNVVFLFCFVVKTLANLDHLDNDVEFQCIQHCPVQNLTDMRHYDYACDYNCNIDQCTKGCKLWRKALNLTCQETCNGTAQRLTPKQLYCVMGCNDAVTKYYAQLKALVGIPPAPALLADSLNATSLKLEWKFPVARKAGLGCYVQWKFEEIASSWQFCANCTWNQQSSIFFVQNLEPYTKYRFRIALMFRYSGYNENLIASTSSVVISTLASGAPTSTPTNVRATPVDSTSISISWEPGQFPHGPLLSYVLLITDNYPEVHSEVKDIPPENSFYMVRNVKPSRNYTIAIRMRNNYGFGPAAEASVYTPAEIHVNNTQQPILILGTESCIFELGNIILGEPINVYQSQAQIRGIGIHIRKKLIFITDSDGYISKLPLKPNSREKTHILKPQNLDFKPLDLTVDWLNDQLYILGEVKYQISRYIIKRCNLDGSSLTVAYADLSKKPNSLQIDPFSGYLFWTIQDYNRGGLYRLNISDISNGIKHEVKIRRILNETELGAFMVDYTSFNLFVAYQRQNTIMSVSLDGTVISNLRPKVRKPQMQKVVSLATANKKFYWTNGIDVFYEEYHQQIVTYFHNNIPIPHLNNSAYKKVFINLPSSQPWPVPRNPPTNVQAIFGRNIAKTRWQPPHLLGDQGKGAWQNWSYEVLITDANSNETVSHSNINQTFFTINNLKENSEYIISVAAYTESGKGPCSSEFRGTTLNKSKNPLILWSAAEGLMKSNAAGENFETIIHRSRMKNLHFTDITWFNEQIYLVTNESHVHWYNLTSHKQGQLVDMDSVGSIAVDWIGMKLYWSNPKQQLIIRGNLNGTQQEPLLTTLAKELNIDSIQAYLYWSTDIKVECAHLNGGDKMEYHNAEYFSGKQVMGLTLDMDQKFVYWIVRGSESNLYRAPMQGYGDYKKSSVKVTELEKPNMQGPLCYFHKRLLWLQDDTNAAISDLSGKNIATINGKSIWGLNMVYVVDSSLHVLPGDSGAEINVLPEMTDKTSVRVIGSSESFNVTWNPIKNVNYGTVFYEVQIDSSLNNDSTIINTTVPSIRYWREVTPFTPLNVTIRAFTYWGTSPQVRAEIFSPPSIPSAPRNLRAYVIYKHNPSAENKYVSITFRWDFPLNPNGVLQGFKIRCWYMDNDVEMDICDNTTTMANETEYKLLDLENNEIYYFEVQAFSEIGAGTMSDPISVNSSHEWPLPTLLIASSDSIFIDDIDANHIYPLVDSITTPVEVNYLLKENSLFWINKKQELLMYNLLTSNQTKIFDITGKPKGFTLDWLERSLYYVEIPKDTKDSIVYKLDLNHIGKGIIKNIQVLYTSANISKIEVSPFTKKLYWVETTDGITHKLMQSNTDGTHIKPFFSHHNHNKRDVDEVTQPCNCQFFSEVGPSFTIDHSDIKTKPLLIFIDPYTSNVVSADKDSCFCNIVANNTIVSNSLPLDHIKSDFGTFYWTNPSQSLLYALKRKEANILTKEVKLSDIVIYGQHMQPYPPKHCLSPKQHDNFTVSLNYKSSHSLNLQMPDLIIHKDCFNFSMATVTYTLSYSKYNNNNTNCSKDICGEVITFNDNVEIDGLQPFTKYIVSVAVSNHFTESSEMLIGPPSIFQTAPGVPSKPKNVTALVLNPNLAKVHWLPPEQLNGLIVYYEIHWQTDGSLSGVRQKGEQLVTDQHSFQNDTNTLQTLLHKLSPNESYTVWVRAYSETNDSSSDSERVQITTYPEPTSFTLINRTAYSIKLIWEITQHMTNYNVEYTPITSNEWNKIETEKKSENIFIHVKNLKPKTQYKFRISLLYENNTDLYIWPTDSRFTFETLGDRPSPPGIPIIQYVKKEMYKVWWEAAKDNGAPIELYKLEGKILISYRDKRSTNRTAPWFITSPSIELEEPEWETFYNGTDTSWIMDDTLNEKHKYAFRVSALNSYGWSGPSEESNEFDLNEAARMAEKHNPMNLMIIATGVTFSICILIVVVFCYVMCSGKGKQKKIQQVVSIPGVPDVELATLRELPRRGIHNTNILYVSAHQAPEEITLLPHIRRDQISLTKFLGSGAFGEVFEGKAKGIGSNNTDTKVAVKTLKKGASDQEKTEFLQEAQLMSHFKHEHILQLLGVCLDNDPHFIIMELMQGGDLLTYLRDSRNPSTDTPSLNLIELLKMCVDVSKGCKYLEELHFVHRDLACRNCLVSPIETDTRIVKIGDFGLARDIYKNDYYRKEGEGLLPVRWMAPESLVDGVFTSQSDVWAFGVLLWEIMTLGQQPYPARANLEVLHYVRRGGRLGKPIDCPKELHELMLECWEFEPEKRPTFKYCLEVLENLHRQILRNPTTGAHEGQYISTVPELFAGISNAAYFRDDNYNRSGNSWKCEIDDEANKEKTPFLPPQKKYAVKEIPKYLELVYEPEAPLENDGYEVPNLMLHANISESATMSSSNSAKSDSSVMNNNSPVVKDVAILIKNNENSYLNTDNTGNSVKS